MRREASDLAGEREGGRIQIVPLLSSPARVAAAYPVDRFWSSTFDHEMHSPSVPLM